MRGLLALDHICHKGSLSQYFFIPNARISTLGCLATQYINAKDSPWYADLTGSVASSVIAKIQ